MDPETPTAAELTLSQAFLLLATNDKDGKPLVPVFAVRTGLAGAVLAELDLAGAIELQGKRVRATGAAAPPELQHELEVIRGKSRRHTPKRWVSILESRAKVERVYEGMAARGIVERVGEKHLGLFKSTRYPEKDHGPEAALLATVEAAISGVPADAGAPDAPAPDARTTALIAVLQAAGVLDKLVPAADKRWASELAKDYWPARAVEDELRLIRLAEEEAPAL